MGKCFLHGNGGGNQLNFKVIGGTTEPASQSGNIIWVNTDTKITGWMFSPTEPETPVSGMVWFITSFRSVAKFNALKKNGIHVFPLSAKQYIDGAWVNVTAQSYNDGNLVEWLQYLYISGDECTPITGGWEKYFVSSGSFNKSGTLTKNSDHMQIQCASNSCVVARTVNKVDVTDYTVAEFDVECITKFDSYVLNCFVTDLEAAGAGHTELVAYSSTDKLANGERGIISVDISTLEGLHYVGVKAWQYENSTTINYKVREVVLK